jgi:hypothetical protein
MIPISNARLERHLTPLGAARAATLTSLVVGANAQLAENPVIDHLLAPDSFAIVAAMYGTARRTCVECIDDARSTDSERQVATDTLATMDQIIALTDTADSAPPARRSINDILGNLDEVIGAGAVDDLIAGSDLQPAEGHSEPESAL